jgi:hypothetical protein
MDFRGPPFKRQRNNLCFNYVTSIIDTCLHWTWKRKRIGITTEKVHPKSATYDFQLLRIDRMFVEYFL